MSNNTNEQAIKEVLSACKYMIDESIKNAPFDKTYTGIITAIIDSINNKYNVIVYDKTYTLTSYSPYSFAVNDIVVVVAPQNNMNFAYILAKNNSYPVSNYNFVRNPDFQIWENGTYFSLPTTQPDTPILIANNFFAYSRAVSGTTSTASVQNVNGKPRMTVSGARTFSRFGQLFERNDSLPGKQITLSCNLSNITLAEGYYMSLLLGFSDEEIKLNTTGLGDLMVPAHEGINTITAIVPEGKPYMRCHIQVQRGDVADTDLTCEFTVGWFKIEYGSSYTPFKSPIYSDELLRSQEVPQRFGGAGGNLGGTACMYNRNILDNWYFLNPVNQRGATNYTTANSYTIDRWYNNGAGTVTVTSNGLVVNGTQYNRIEQYIENSQLLNGQVVTASVLVKNPDNKIRINVYNRTTSVSRAYDFPASSTFQLCSFTTTVTGATSSSIGFLIYPGADQTTSKSMTIVAAKLEIGSKQTLAHQDINGNWVLNEIPNYGEQLARCQRYFLALGKLNGAFGSFSIAAVESATQAKTLIPLPVPMIKYPTMTSTGSFMLLVRNATVPVTALSLSDMGETQITVNLTVSGVTAGDSGIFRKNNDASARIFLSAEDF